MTTIPLTSDASEVGIPAPAGAATWRIGFGRVALTALHLVALGILGTIVFTVAITFFSVGVSTAIIAGIGFVFLVALVYMLYGTAWFEIERANGLYGFSVAPLARRRPERPGFGGWVKSILRQSVDGRMWAALVSFAAGSTLGLALVWLLQICVFGLFVPAAFAWPVDEWVSWAANPLAKLLFVLVALAACLGLSLLHAIIARALLGSPSRSELATEVRQKSAQREGAVRAAEVERTRIERDLHDGVQPRLVSIGMTLGLAQQKIEHDPDAAKQLVAEAHTSTKAAITELRQLARGIHASVLDDRGLDAALSALAARSHVPVHLDVRMDGMGDARTRASCRDAEAALYFSIAEALTNAAKHSRAGECRVTVRLRNAGTPASCLWARIEDNGIGGAAVQPGGGLDGISNRVLAAGGTFHLDSPQGGPTALEVSVPCAF